MIEGIIPNDERAIRDTRQIFKYSQGAKVTVLVMQNGDLLIGKKEKDGKVRQARYVTYNYLAGLQSSNENFIFIIVLLVLSCVLALMFLNNSFYYVLGVILLIFFMNLLNEAKKQAHKKMLKEKITKICEKHFG
jgi:sensor histidine kinase YesM